MARTYSVTHGHVRNSEIKQLRQLYFAMLWDIDLIFGMCVYNDKLQIKLTFRSSPMIFGRVMAWTLKFGQIFSCHYLFSLCLEILTWCLVYECIMMSYRLSLHFVPLQWFLALELWNLAKYLVVTTFFSLCLEILTLFLVWVYNDELQIKFTFRSSPMIFGQVMALGHWNLAKYLVVTTLFHYDLRYWIEFWYESV